MPSVGVSTMVTVEDLRKINAAGPFCRLAAGAATRVRDED